VVGLVGYCLGNAQQESGAQFPAVEFTFAIDRFGPDSHFVEPSLTAGPHRRRCGCGADTDDPLAALVAQLFSGGPRRVHALPLAEVTIERVV
jgi:hypothetical protein